MTTSRRQMSFVACLFAVLMTSAVGARPALAGSARLLQQSPASQEGVTVSVTPGESPFNLSVFNIASNTQCVVQGYPGSRADSVVPGPIIFSIPPSIVAIRTNFQTSNSGLVLYNNTRDVVPENSTGILTFATYYKSSLINSSGSLYGGLIPNYDPNDPAHNAGSPPACYLNVTFVTAASAPTPAPGSLPVLG